MLANSDIIVLFQIYDQFGVIRKSDSGHIVCKTYIFNNSNLLSFKNWKPKNLQHSSHTIALSKGTTFTRKC